jgi:hypothetical protein
MGSGGGSIPEPPKPPTVGESMADYVAHYPALFALQQKYAPQEAEMMMGLAQQYAEPYGQAMLSAQKAMYPEEYDMRSSLMEQAKEYQQDPIPDWMADQWRDEFRANLGTSAGSPVGAEYMSRGMQQMGEERRRYGQNMGLTLSGGQPIMQAQAPATTNQLSGFGPTNVMGYNANTYGTYAGAMNQRNIAQANLDAQPSPWFGVLGSISGGLATGLGYGWATG